MVTARDIEVVIVGAGFGGLGMGVALSRAGISDFVILEKDDGVGGTWRANRYPGAACDIESHLYSFSFAPNPEWSRKFAPQAEILSYLEDCARRFGLLPHLRTGVAVTRAVLDEATGRWLVEASDGTSYRARALVAATGGLSRPALPDIAGLDTFVGPRFHSARWDAAASLDGRRVGVIGTGASAIQIVPALSPRVARLTVFQRSAPWILPKADRAIPESERARLRAAPWRQRLERAAQFWRHELQTIAFATAPKLLAVAEREARQHLAHAVADPALRARLTPDYRIGCKRILLSNDYYAALQAPNAALVTRPIAAVEPGGVRTRDGALHELDALVLATGFHAADVAAPFDVRGLGGRALDDAWRDGAEAYLGTMVAGFPNLFLIVGPNTGLGSSSMVLMIESQVALIVSALELLRQRRARLLDVCPDAQRRWNDEVARRLGKTVWASGCKSWYLAPSGRNTTLWPGYTLEFRRRTRAVDPRDLVLS